METRAHPCSSLTALAASSTTAPSSHCILRLPIGDQTILPETSRYRRCTARVDQSINSDAIIISNQQACLPTARNQAYIAVEIITT